MRCSLPRPNGPRVIHADRPVLLNDPAATLGSLPFESNARQSLRGDSRPHEAPEVFPAPCSFPSLNSRGHSLQFIPSFRRSFVSVLLQEITAVEEQPDIRSMRHGDELVMRREAL